MFFLEEYWWYAVHLLCMGTAFVFMIGGIYALEVKDITRDRFHDWSNETKAHVMLGSIAMVCFGIQLFTSPFRMWIIKHRIFNIIFHFLIGMMNYMLGSKKFNTIQFLMYLVLQKLIQLQIQILCFLSVAAVLIATAIPQSRMSCYAFYMYIAFLGFQACVYIYMEVSLILMI